MSHHNETTTNTYGMGKKTLKSYIFGLLLSLIFTFSSFGIVAHHSFPTTYIFIVLTVLAVSQLIAQVIFFLRMNVSPEGRWNLMPFLFTIIIVAVLVGGSLWIMYNLNYNMMN